MSITHRHPKEYRRGVDAALAQGWRVVHRKRHAQLRAPDRQTIVTVPGTPGDQRSLRNFEATLRRSGVRL